MWKFTGEFFVSAVRKGVNVPRKDEKVPLSQSRFELAEHPP